MSETSFACDRCKGGGENALTVSLEPKIIDEVPISLDLCAACAKVVLAVCGGASGQFVAYTMEQDKFEVSNGFDPEQLRFLRQMIDAKLKGELPPTGQLVYERP